MSFLSFETQDECSGSMNIRRPKFSLKINYKVYYELFVEKTDLGKKIKNDIKTRSTTGLSDKIISKKKYDAVRFCISKNFGMTVKEVEDMLFNHYKNTHKDISHEHGFFKPKTQTTPFKGLVSHLWIAKFRLNHKLVDVRICRDHRGCVSFSLHKDYELKKLLKHHIAFLLSCLNMRKFYKIIEKFRK